MPSESRWVETRVELLYNTRWWADQVIASPERAPFAVTVE